MEIQAREKAQYEQSFKDAMESAKDYEGGEYWEDALGKYEMEFQGTHVNSGASIKGTTYIKGDKGGKLNLVGVENITMAPNATKTPWPGQKLRFVLIFPPLPDNATEFDLIEPSSAWKYKDIKCR